MTQLKEMSRGSENSARDFHWEQVWPTYNRWQLQPHVLSTWLLVYTRAFRVKCGIIQSATDPWSGDQATAAISQWVLFSASDAENLKRLIQLHEQSFERTNVRELEGCQNANVQHSRWIHRLHLIVVTSVTLQLQGNAIQPLHAIWIETCSAVQRRPMSTASPTYRGGIVSTRTHWKIKVSNISMSLLKICQINSIAAYQSAVWLLIV